MAQSRAPRGAATAASAALLALALCCSLHQVVAREAVYRATYEINQRTINPDCLSPRVTALVNGRMPGPTIIVREGTRLEITFINRQSLPITIHWHGITQHNSPWMDGVPGVTQCDIMQGMRYTYNFSTANEAGTFWWHAHVAMLRNSVFGALIVDPVTTKASQGRIPPPAPPRGRHVLYLMDWYYDTPKGLMTNMPGWIPPDTVFINGGAYMPSNCPDWRKRIWTALVRPATWYRIHVVNTALFTAFNIAFQGHDFWTYEAEGGYMRPRRFTDYTILSGQSYQFLLYTRARPGQYWMRSSPKYDSEGIAPALGLLRYTNTPPAVIRSGRLPSGVGFVSGPFRDTVPSQLRRTEGAVRPPAWINRVDKRIILELNYDERGGTQVGFSTNNVSSHPPPTPALYSAYKGNYKALNPGLIPSTPPKNLASYKGPAKKGFGVFQLPYGATVELVFQNRPMIQMHPHPFHLHGYNFYVVGRGVGTFNPRTARMNLKNPTFRNTEWVGNNQWVAFRFRATNPGVWYSHCHLEPHADTNMAATFHNLPPRGMQGPGFPRFPNDWPNCQGRKLT